MWKIGLERVEANKRLLSTIFSKYQKSFGFLWDHLSESEQAVAKYVLFADSRYWIPRIPCRSIPVSS